VTAVSERADTHGTVTLAGGTITYTPDAGFEGTATFGYTACDDGTTQALPDPLCTDAGLVTVQVTAPDQPPVANGQSLTVAEDQSLPVQLSGSDPEGDPLTFAVAQPLHGTLTGDAPAVVYTPDPDYYGPDSFTFTTHDGASSSSPATVLVDVTEVNDPPVVGPDALTLGGAGTLPPPPPAPACGDPCGVIFGDPHLATFDDVSYDVQAVGELIVAKSTTGGDFEIQARFSAVPGSRVV
jgi:hypothetical protein